MNMRAFIRRNYSTIMLSVIFICGCVIVMFSVAQQSSDKQLLTEVKNNQREIKANQEKLIELGKSNSHTNDRAIFYSKCVAKLFAAYTKTQSPVNIDDITKCEYTVDD